MSEPRHPLYRKTIEAHPQIGTPDVSRCLPGWIDTLCKKVEQDIGIELNSGATRALCHTLIDDKVRADRLLAENERLKAEHREARSIMEDCNARQMHIECWCDADGRSGTGNRCLQCRINAFLARTPPLRSENPSLIPRAPADRRAVVVADRYLAAASGDKSTPREWLLAEVIAGEYATDLSDAELLRWLQENPEHEAVPYYDQGKWHIPYLMSNDGGAGGGVANRTFDTLREAVTAAKQHGSKTADAPPEVLQ